MEAKKAVKDKPVKPRGKDEISVAGQRIIIGITVTLLICIVTMVVLQYKAPIAAYFEPEVPTEVVALLHPQLEIPEPPDPPDPVVQIAPPRVETGIERVISRNAALVVHEETGLLCHILAPEYSVELELAAQRMRCDYTLVPYSDTYQMCNELTGCMDFDFELLL